MGFVGLTENMGLSSTGQIRICNVLFLLLTSVSPSLGFTQHCHEGTGRCYWISDTSQGTWEQGRTACQSEGGDLAVMETKELHNYATKTIR